MSNGTSVSIVANAPVADNATLGNNQLGSVFSLQNPGDLVGLYNGQALAGYEYIDASGKPMAVMSDGTLGFGLPKTIPGANGKGPIDVNNVAGKQGGGVQIGGHDLVSVGKGADAVTWDYTGISGDSKSLMGDRVTAGEDGFLTSTNGQLLKMDGNGVRLATRGEAWEHLGLNDSDLEGEARMSAVDQFKSTVKANFDKDMTDADIASYAKNQKLFNAAERGKLENDWIKGQITQQKWGYAFGLIDKVCQATLAGVQAWVQIKQASAQMEMVNIQRTREMNQAALAMADLTAKKELNEALAKNGAEANRLNAKVEITKAKLNAKNTAKKIQADSVVQLFSVRNSRNLGNPYMWG